MPEPTFSYRFAELNVGSPLACPNGLRVFESERADFEHTAEWYLVEESVKC